MGFIQGLGFILGLRAFRVQGAGSAGVGETGIQHTVSQGRQAADVILMTG